jgi:hypothetical protein
LTSESRIPVSSSDSIAVCNPTVTEAFFASPISFGGAPMKSGDVGWLVGELHAPH